MGGRSFSPGVGSSLLLGALVLACLGLGRWQLERADYKRERLAEFASAPVLERLDPAAAVAPFARLRLQGSFDPERHFLVDNQVLQGRAGVQVLTPFYPADGGVTILVNRGWLPMPPDRSALPAVPTPPGPLSISGHLEALHKPGLELGAADQPGPNRWPQLLTYPELSGIEGALGAKVYRQVLYLDADSPGGFEGRDWQPVTMSPERHTAYAVQWFALALTGVAAWTLLGMRRSPP